jgi:hypothetical protein
MRKGTVRYEMKRKCKIIIEIFSTRLPLTHANLIYNCKRNNQVIACTLYGQEIFCGRRMVLAQKVHILYTTLSVPTFELRPLPILSPASGCVPSPPKPKGRGTHSPAGGKGHNLDDLRTVLGIRDILVRIRIRTSD